MLYELNKRVLTQNKKESKVLQIHLPSSTSFSFQISSQQTINNKLIPNP